MGLGGGNLATEVAVTGNCHLTRAEWVFLPEKREMAFHITANRFLRGMVRLIVGMCLNVGLGKITVEQVKFAMDHKTRLDKSLSAPANGLALSLVEY